MADKYDTWPVNSNRAGKQAFRPILLVLDNKNINDISKPALIEIFQWFDRKYHPLFLSDRDIENRLSKEQKAVLKQEVDRYRELARLKKEQTPKAKDPKMARKNGTAKPATGKARLRMDETTPVDGEAADEDQDGDVRMADREDTAPLIDQTAEAVPSPVGGKRKRTATVPPSDSKRPRIGRSKLSLIVTLKLPDMTGLELGSIQTTTQVSETQCDNFMTLLMTMLRVVMSMMARSRMPETCGQRTPGALLGTEARGYNVVWNLLLSSQIPLKVAITTQTMQTPREWAMHPAPPCPTTHLSSLRLVVNRNV
jgi:hypothetical protein